MLHGIFTRLICTQFKTCDNLALPSGLANDTKMIKVSIQQQRLRPVVLFSSDSTARAEMSNLSKLKVKTRRDWREGVTALFIFSYPEPSVPLAKRLVARRETGKFEEMFLIECPVTLYIVYTTEILR